MSARGDSLELAELECLIWEFAGGDDTLDAETRCVVPLWLLRETLPLLQELCSLRVLVLEAVGAGTRLAASDSDAANEAAHLYLIKGHNSSIEAKK